MQQLDGRTLSRLETAVAKSEYVGQGKKLKVTNKVGSPESARQGGANKRKVNPDVMGGLVVEIGDRTIDLSVSSKVARMNKLLTDTL